VKFIARLCLPLASLKIILELMTNPENIRTPESSFEQIRTNASREIRTFLDMHDKEVNPYIARDPDERKGSWGDEAGDLELSVNFSSAWDGSSWSETVHIYSVKGLAVKKVVISAHSIVGEDSFYKDEIATRVYETGVPKEEFTQGREATTVDLQQVAMICNIASADLKRSIRKNKFTRALSDLNRHGSPAERDLKDLNVDESLYFGSIFSQDQ